MLATKPHPPQAPERLNRALLAGMELGEHDLARLLAAHLGLLFLDLDLLDVDPTAAALLSRDDAETYGALPIGFSRGAVLVVVARPTNVPAIVEVRRRIGREIRVAVAARSDLLRAIERTYRLALPPAPEPEPELGPEPEPELDPPTQDAARPRRRPRARVVVALFAAFAASALAGDVTARVTGGGEPAMPARAISSATPPAAPSPAAPEWQGLPLADEFALEVSDVAARQRVDAALLLAAFQAGGARDLSPADAAARLAAAGAATDPWAALLALDGRTGFADRALALAAYIRAAGPRPSEAELAPRLLRDPRVELSAQAERALATGTLDVRMLGLAVYVADVHGRVAVREADGRTAVLAAPPRADADRRSGDSLLRSVLLLPEPLRPISAFPSASKPDGLVPVFPAPSAIRVGF